MEILQEREKLSEESAKIYLEEAEEALKRIDEHSVFINNLCEIISNLKKVNAGDTIIISKLQDKFHFDKDDAEFFYEYALKRHMDKIFDSNVEKPEEAVKEAKKNRECQHESMTLSMRDKENQKIGEKKLAKLIMLLNEDGRISDIIRVSQDEEYRQKLYVEYHIV